MDSCDSDSNKRPIEPNILREPNEVSVFVIQLNPPALNLIYISIYVSLTNEFPHVTSFVF